MGKEDVALGCGYKDVAEFVDRIHDQADQELCQEIACGQTARVKCDIGQHDHKAVRKPHVISSEPIVSYKQLILVIIDPRLGQLLHPTYHLVFPLP